MIGYNIITPYFCIGWLNKYLQVFNKMTETTGYSEVMLIRSFLSFNIGVG